MQEFGPAVFTYNWNSACIVYMRGNTPIIQSNYRYLFVLLSLIGLLYTQKANYWLHIKGNH